MQAHMTALSKSYIGCETGSGKLLIKITIKIYKNHMISNHMILLIMQTKMAVSISDLKMFEL